MVGRVTNGLFGPASARGRLGFRWKFVRSRSFFFHIPRNSRFRRTVGCRQFAGQLHVGHERGRTFRKRKQIGLKLVVFAHIKTHREGFTQHAAYSFDGLVQPTATDDNNSIQLQISSTAGRN